ncbi:hypothetical protein NIES4071_20740 [Calothrix sp. NIES-4071]|nr:hypothetical protein NIES4071_20740 [Calothrix sp. NIES-4071]BAZ56406.1 hypothetical protein NIES4105_20690 [Calothrix sp. NIES-4105]
MRKAALFAAEESNEIAISDKHLDEALYELVDLRGVLAQNLLGVGKAFN